MPPRASSSSSSNPSSSKKRKTALDEADSNDPPPPPSPSTSYFFADGNVLLHVEDTLFKVYKSVLERAEVFADTLLVRREEGGLPTIKLTDEKEDWELLLRALYDGFAFAEKLPTLLQTRSLLILADKYNHRPILEAAKSSFVARSTYEETHRNRTYETEQQYQTYLHDDDFPPSSDNARRGLLALQEGCDLDRSSVRWIHNYVALKLPTDRNRFVHEYEDKDETRACWFPRAMSMDTHLSILLRVDHFASLAFDSWSDSEILDKHDDKICRQTSACREVLSNFWPKSQTRFRREPFDVALKKLAEYYETEVSVHMNRSCKSYASQFWDTTIADFKTEIGEGLRPLIFASLDLFLSHDPPPSISRFIGGKRNRKILDDDASSRSLYPPALWAQPTHPSLPPPSPPISPSISLSHSGSPKKGYQIASSSSSSSQKQKRLVPSRRPVVRSWYHKG